MAESTVLVRIKPYNKRRGHLVRRYVYTDRRSGIRYRFEESRGWYRVPLKIGKALSKIHSKSEDQDSPLAFDVKTEEEAQQVDASEEIAREERASATRARSASDARSAAEPPRTAARAAKPPPEPEPEPEPEAEPEADEAADPFDEL